jgi:glycerophosphoryl diester phosphodiesterase
VLAIVWFASACSTDHRIAPESDMPASTNSAASAFTVIAHRGGAGLAPENTLPAFRRSLALGFTQVELDVRRSQDGVLVLFHDRSLEAKVGRVGSVDDYAASELQSFDIGGWFDREHPEIAESFAGTHLITLSQLFEALGPRLYYHVEIKGDDPRVPPLVIQQIDAFGLHSRVTVTSFSREQIERIRTQAPSLPVCWLIARHRELEGDERALFKANRSAIDTAVRAGFDEVAIRANELSADLVSDAHARGLRVRAYGIRSESDEDRVIQSGSDGATTDWPLRLRDRLDAQRR